MERDSVLGTMVRKDVSKEVPFKQRPEWNESVNSVNIWQDISDKGNGMCKGPEEEVCFCLEGAAGRHCDCSKLSGKWYSLVANEMGPHTEHEGEQTCLVEMIDGRISTAIWKPSSDQD